MIALSKSYLIEKLQVSQKQISALLEYVVHNQDWQPFPEAWSYRFIATHMA